MCVGWSVGRSVGREHSVANSELFRMRTPHYNVQKVYFLFYSTPPKNSWTFVYISPTLHNTQLKSLLHLQNKIWKEHFCWNILSNCIGTIVGVSSLLYRHIYCFHSFWQWKDKRLAWQVGHFRGFDIFSPNCPECPKRPKIVNSSWKSVSRYICLLICGR